MGMWEQQEWTSVAEHVPRRERRTGPFSSYLPDTLRKVPSASWTDAVRAASHR
jgi:hypothetical protein